MNYHGRGDVGDVDKRKRSIQRISLRPELSAPPWLVKLSDADVRANPDQEGCVTGLTWGTRGDGVKLALPEDTERKNVMAQLADALVLENCRLYLDTIPNDAAAFLVALGNSLNEDSTATTPIEICQKVPDVLPAWERHKNSLDWSIEALPDSEINEAKLAIGNEIIPNYVFKTWSSLDRVITMHRIH